MPVAKTFRQRTPFAAVPGQQRDRVENIEIGNPHIARCTGSSERITS